MSRQTAYIPLQRITKASYDNIGGFCKFWYTPIENISLFPLINPATQMLSNEPYLLPGTIWYGPVDIPDKKFGWTAEQERVGAGVYFKQKVTGFVPGLSAENHINFQNLVFHKFAIVGKARSGGNFYIIGDDEIGLDATFDIVSGDGAEGTPGASLQFTGETVDNALLLPGFAGELSQTPVFGYNNQTGEVVDGTEAPATGGPNAEDSGGYSGTPPTGGTNGDNSGGTDVGPTPGTTDPTPTTAGDTIHDLSITSLGNEGFTLYVPTLTGKTVIFLARESQILKRVSATPTNRQYTVNATGDTFTFSQQIDPEEEFKFLYKD